MEYKYVNLRSLKLDDTLIQKGIAILLLLYGHLFFCEQMYLVDDISIAGHGIIQTSAKFIGSLCVQIFVLLSGYGLGMQYALDKSLNIKSFYMKRFKKLYTGYWFIWLIFVPMGIWIFGRDLSSVYGEEPFIPCLLNLFGLQKIFGTSSYNDTWWFMSCIIGLYVIFPIIHKLSIRNLKILIFLSFVVSLLKIPVGCVFSHLFPFLMGFFMTRVSYLKVPSVIPMGGAFLLFIMCLLLAMGLIVNFGTIIYQIAAVILCFAYMNKQRSFEYIDNLLGFIGKHSMNIFLFHTFIYFYYFQNIIYWSRNAVLIYCSLLSICLIISIILNYTKSFLKI